MKHLNHAVGFPFNFNWSYTVLRPPYIITIIRKIIIPQHFRQIKQHHHLQGIKKHGNNAVDELGEPKQLKQRILLLHVSVGSDQSWGSIHNDYERNLGRTWRTKAGLGGITLNNPMPSRSLVRLSKTKFTISYLAPLCATAFLQTYICHRCYIIVVPCAEPEREQKSQQFTCFFEL